MRPALLIVFVLAALMTTPATARAQSSGPAEAAAEIARLLATASPPGTLAGYPATYRVDRGGRGAGRTTYAVLQAAIPDPALLLQVRPRASEVRAPAGPTAEVQVGDPAFDAAYVVEGAPSDLVRAMLDAPLRRAMLDAGPVIVDIDERWMDVSRGGVPASLDEARRFHAVALLVAAHLRDGLVASPDTALGASARAAELARLRAIRAQRRQANIPFLIVMALVGLGVVALLVRNASRRRSAAAPPARR